MPSTTPPIHVKPVVDALTRFGEDARAKVTTQEVEPGKHNCILTFDFGAGKTLVFNTHMDVNMDLCQYFGQKKLKYYADFFSSSSSLCCGVI